ncbi:uncharacterized protein LOC123549036 isoform X5 [Mercenaria mercenaria]|uniref:uncharacterized protein LOC123549036 isoform X5 n=1 Tax=Mercenaria mercenaria TaxID=6596 RepID=UPI00234F86A1|nr:uncharacterized protein LOC123549036 isoform X5 [Mercenaria mercenaria]
MALKLQVDETNCGPLCQHPSCWQSNVRQEKGFPKLRARPRTPPDIELDLPTLKVCNMLDDYGEDKRDLFPSRYGGKPAHDRNELYSTFEKPVRTQSIKVTRAPQTSPKSGTNSEPPVSKFKVVEVQEVFDPEDLSRTWDDTFIPKSYYVWVPNMKKKRRRKMAKNQEESPMTKLKGKGSVKFKDMTEDMVPKEIENSRITARFEEWPVLKKKRASARSPIMPQYSMSPRTTQGSSKMEFDHEGYRRSGQISVPIPSRVSGWRTPGNMVFLSISELLDLPRDVLVQVLENTRQSDLMSREKIREVIRRFMPPSLERGNTNISLASQDLLQQKKLNLHEGNKNVRESHLMETKPVFHLDDDLIDDDEIDEDIQRSTSPYGSLKELYLSRDFNKYKKPLPAISAGGRAVSAGDMLSTKIPSISLGLPELPSGIRQTKAFTYSKKADLDFTLDSSAGSPCKTPTSSKGPVPTPPTSVRSTETPGSDHGTTIRVNVPSQASARSGSEKGEKRRESPTRGSPVHPLHAVSPTYSTRVPNAPAGTPATFPMSPTKSAPLLRDMTGSTMANTPQEWPPRDKLNSPLQILRAPVNTPGSLAQEASGLHTIHESGTVNEGDDLAHPVSRGRSVRFEIPEIPPPPSSPQLSEDGQKEASRNAVTVNTNIPQETPSTSSNKPPSGVTIRTTATTVNTSTLQAENSFIRSYTGPVREISLISSPEPWPQVQDADFEEAPVPSPETTLHETPRETPQTLEPLESETKSENENQSKNAQEVVVEEEKTEPSEKKEKDSEYVNKTEDQSAVVKKMMEESRKAESPAPPPPSPEAKEDSQIIINKPNSTMTTLVEEEETANAPDNEVSMTVMQISPKGPMIKGGQKSHNRQIDTFQNIDIPAEFDLDYVHPHVQEPTTDTIVEEPEPAEDDAKSARTYALSVQSTLANRTISEQAHSEVSSSFIEPAISQASQGPALSEDFSEKRENSELFGDWSGMVIGSSDGQNTQAMLSSDKPDMTEDGGDHEGFKEDLRQEFEKIKQEIDSSKDSTEKS